jgi:hypothetical protein
MMEQETHCYAYGYGETWNSAGGEKKRKEERGIMCGWTIVQSVHLI